MFRLIRRLFLLLVIVAVFGALAYLITAEDAKRQRQVYALRVTLGVQTAIAQALFDATRTAESHLRQYRLVIIQPGEALDEIAGQYNTTVEVLRMANGLLPDVEFGNGETLIVPEGVNVLFPPRRFSIHTAIAGDTLESLAKFYAVSLDLLEGDNPVLAARGVIPGDIVFIPVVLTS
ncbi:MAG: LysM peptidoglycan-binding domain-containing protein [Chloroflexi bacterium]|nr:LysM peptidoglycan-binding domain-containing protein [Chloroflexota bacterium]